MAGKEGSFEKTASHSAQAMCPMCRGIVTGATCLVPQHSTGVVGFLHRQQVQGESHSMD